MYQEVLCPVLSLGTSVNTGVKSDPASACVMQCFQYIACSNFVVSLFCLNFTIIFILVNMVIPLIIPHLTVHHILFSSEMLVLQLLLFKYKRVKTIY